MTESTFVNEIINTEDYTSVKCEWGIITLFKQYDYPRIVIKHYASQREKTYIFTHHKTRGYYVIWRVYNGVKDVTFNILESIVRDFKCISRSTTGLHKIMKAFQDLTGSPWHNQQHLTSPLLKAEGVTYSLNKSELRTILRYSDYNYVYSRLFPGVKNRRLKRTVAETLNLKVKTLVPALAITIGRAMSQLKVDPQVVANTIEGCASNPERNWYVPLPKEKTLKLFIKALLDNYTTKTVSRILSSISETSPATVNDTIRMWSDLPAGAEIEYPARPSWKGLHDYFMVLARKLRSPDREITYENCQCKELDGITFENYYLELPKSTHQMHDWGAQFGNCVGSYGGSVLRGSTIIARVHTDGKPSQTIELSQRQQKCDYEVVQAETFCARDMPEDWQESMTEKINEAVRAARKATK